ncbi:ChaN family lipoprotein [Ancylothrix sp. C2]|uniref:ChaN family lipoprotein n=1 Tax=Ancylothrix sp. D3o TaxID=2953691 RepID=UPI0021BAD633|nr:ChaN family lipoprotein [Ancylothrix sp. D3o]MCT7949598.1 ChaN family lipoprotein [Ancylothrix sp. D3o]
MTKFLAFSLGFLLLCTGTAEAQKITSPVEQQIYTREQFFPLLEKANVVYLGETHDSEADHKAQLQIIQQLHSKNPKIAIAMEMFQRPFQGVIDDYLAGKISEVELFEKSEYNKRWGFDWELYAPILRFAKANNLRVLALNTPSEVTRKVARGGLQSLTAEDRLYIPSDAEIRTDNAEYKNMVMEVFKQHSGAGHGNSANFDNFFLAQVLWDETMAETIANFAQNNPDYQVVVLAGKGHIIYGYGIPSRVMRRVNNAGFIQRSILLNPDQDWPLKDGPVADFFWHD